MGVGGAGRKGVLGAGAGSAPEHQSAAIEIVYVGGGEESNVQRGQRGQTRDGRADELSITPQDGEAAAIMHAGHEYFRRGTSRRAATQRRAWSPVRKRG
jgi:hypothetical protein